MTALEFPLGCHFEKKGNTKKKKMGGLDSHSTLKKKSLGSKGGGGFILLSTFNFG